MAYLRPLVALALLALGTSAHAGYAQLATPPGFGGTPAGWTYAASSANDSVFGRVIHQPNGLKVPVPGTSTTMPASYRLAANAPRIAAAAIFAMPQVRTAVAIAGWLITAKVVYDAATNTWHEKGQLIDFDGYEYIIGFPGATWTTSKEAACSAYVSYLGSGWYSAGSDPMCRAEHPNGSAAHVYPTSRQTQSSQCPIGWTLTPAGCLSPAINQPRFEELLNPANSPGWPMPERVPLELPPGTPLPVEPPVINPEPGPNPQPRPRFVPTGDPVQNPNYDPNAQPSPENQPYIQPGVRVKPSPTPQEPLRVDLEPVNVPKPTPEPTPETDTTEPGTQPKPEEQQSLCEKHPDIVACQKLGELQPETLQTKTVTLTIERSDGFGPSTGTCPAPKTATIMGKQVAFQWDLLCDFANGIRPLLIGFAYLSAALAFMGLTRRGD